MKNSFHLVTRLPTTSRLAHVSLRLLGKVHWENRGPRPFPVSPSPCPIPMVPPSPPLSTFPTLAWASSLGAWLQLSQTLVPHCREVNLGEKGMFFFSEMGLRFWWTLGPAHTESFFHQSPSPH